MSDPYLGQIGLFGFGFAPRYYASCNGQLLPINQYAALFSLLGTTYGGDGIRTFALPNLQGRCAVGYGQAPGGNYNIGEVAGEINHTLQTAELPAHTHVLAGSSATGAVAAAVNNFPGVSTTNLYSNAAPNTNLGDGSSATGGNQPHANQSPYLVLNFCIALSGIFPSRN